MSARGEAYWAGYEAGEAAQRHNDAAKVRAAGCVCKILEDGDGAFAGTFRGVDTSEGFERIVVDHDPRCPHALADLILEGGA